MGSFIGSIVVNVSNGKRASGFWKEALGYVAHPGNPEFLVPPEWETPVGYSAGTQCWRDVGAHLHLDGADKMHIDLWVNAGESLESEVERLVALGASRVDWDYQEGAQRVVLADPEGNLFCVCASTRRGAGLSTHGTLPRFGPAAKPEIETRSGASPHSLNRYGRSCFMITWPSLCANTWTVLPAIFSDPTKSKSREVEPGSPHHDVAS